MQQLIQALMAVANIYNNNNKYHLFARVRVSEVSQITLRERERVNSKSVFTTKRDLD
jgi:hypothetical protein